MSLNIDKVILKNAGDADLTLIGNDGDSPVAIKIPHGSTQDIGPLKITGMIYKGVKRRYTRFDETLTFEWIKFDQENINFGGRLEFEKGTARFNGLYESMSYRHYGNYTLPSPPRYSVASNNSTNTSRRIPPPTTRIDPLSRFPQEIVSCIFALACEAKIFHHSGQWHRECYPHRLGQVSRSWRHAAWGTSELWKTIVLPLGRAASLVGTDTLLNEWIGRSKEHSLDIWMQLPWRSATPDSSKALCGILMALRGCCEKWRTIDLRLTPAFFEIFEIEELRPFADPFSRGLSLPRLESVGLQSHGLEGFVSSLGLDFWDAPNLRELCIGKMTANHGAALPTGFQVPYGQVRRLVCYGCPQLQIGAVLEAFPRLEELEYREDLELVREPEHIIIHEQLKSISVTLADDDDDPFFSPCLILPALKKIRINSSFDMRYAVMLKNFLHNVQVPLTHLHLESTGFEQDDLIITLDLVPSLTHLVIRVANYPDHIYTNNAVLSQAFFQQLNPRHGSFFLPCLEEFEYQGGLAVNNIAFLEAFLLRSQVRRANVVCDYEFAQLRRVKIKAGQQSGIRRISIRGYSDQQYTAEVLTMLDSKKLVLVNGRGEPWH
ncbi:hypothetical protein BJ165DRAFT_1531217 [Panaeolus papilionaceus]|nr:hypothetical protein BJ165DRAFT_1531217 [Panaeolus papilionaceus]